MADALRAFGKYIKDKSGPADSTEGSADQTSVEDATAEDQTSAEQTQADDQIEAQAEEQPANQTEDSQDSQSQSQESQDTQNQSDDSQNAQDQTTDQSTSDDQSQSEVDDQPQEQPDDQPQNQADDQAPDDDQSQAAVLQSITISPDSPTLSAGGQQQFSAQGSFDDGTTQDVTGSVTWSSSDASVVSIDSSGLASVLAGGTATITAAATTGVAGSTGVTVQAQSSVVLQKITVSPQNPLIESGKFLQFSATGTFSDGSTQDITDKVRWTSSAPKVVVIGQDGMAAGGDKPGNATVTATDLATGVTDSTKVTVHAQGKAPALQSITISPSNPSITGFGQQQFKAMGVFTDGSSHEVTTTVIWTSSDLAVVTIDSKGLASAGTVSGTATIAAADPTTGISDTTAISVTVPALQSIAITPQNPSIAAGTTVQFTATGTFSDGSTKDMTGTVSWTSSDLTIVMMGAGGLANSLAAGTATITATDTGTGVTSATSITVTAPVLQKITISPDSVTIPNGFTQEFTAEGEFSDGHTEDMTSTVDWNSAAPMVVDINQSGIATGKTAGTATISATDPGTKIGGLANLSVGAPVVVGLRIRPTNPSVVVGGKVQFSAIGEFSDRHTEDVTTLVSWTSRGNQIVQIDANGTAVGNAPGTTSIAAEDPDKRALQSTNVTVKQ